MLRASNLSNAMLRDRSAGSHARALTSRAASGSPQADAVTSLSAVYVFGHHPFYR